ncbi:hypothetical protein DICVIV_10686 [Dictyocaulus viviparus]|uniref:Uncharacterized protein n=1 Tax=Dictyocaulus viviparus TaxID=29172 RepID=A0A0D8XLQ0_DICVI|nr:hypothetical protein DICVIV_10686 [Dictyocaulus viviparus]
MSQLNGNLTMARGSVAATLSRAAVDWMVNTVDLSTLLDQLNLDRLGVDEVFIPSLQVSEDFDMPGRFTKECVQKGHILDSITRAEIWVYSTVPCLTRNYRHSVCVFGIEDLNRLSKNKRLSANKIRTEFDYSIVECVHELLFNRTYLEQIDNPLNMSYYANRQEILYHKNRLYRNESFKLDCNTNHSTWA